MFELSLKRKEALKKNKLRHCSQNKNYWDIDMENQILLIAILFGVLLVLSRWVSKKKRERRRSYYRNEYLKSDDWQRKRYVVLKRDNWRCVYCGAPATQVHHKKYARWNIGREPIEWLVSVCKSCHESMHN
jgi:5-methylcytosine-specific restriction endonuclease McrA